VLPQVRATRYVLPLKEGGSLPGIVEADDDGMYVVKFRGAGQGLKVLVAEVIVAQLARALGIAVPDLVEIDMPEAIAKYEADEEVQDLLKASPGSNLGVDYLPGSFGYDGSRTPSSAEATAIVWLDAFTANVDRTWANPNLLVWHRKVWAIDHGAALYFHHSWPSRGADAGRFVAQRYNGDTHVLRDVAGDVAAEHERFAALVSDEVVASAVAAVPAEWFEPVPGLVGLESPTAVAASYVEHLRRRRDEPAAWLPGSSGSEAGAS
jgi:HipA-like protein